MSAPPTYSQAPLLDAAARERDRRAARRASLSAGQLVLVSAGAAQRLGLDPGDRLAHVLSCSGATRKIRTTHGAKEVEAQLGDLSPSAQPGDTLRSGDLVLYLDAGTADADPRVYAATARATDGDYPGGGLVATTEQPAATLPAAAWDRAESRVVDLGETCAIRGVDAAGTVGPGLAAADAARAVRPLEPGALRGGVASAKVGGRESVAVDFIGGATLWVWRDLLRPSFVLGVDPEDPLSDARGEWAGAALLAATRPDATPTTLAHKVSPDAHPPAAAAAALSARASRAAALPSAPTPALPEGTAMPALSAAATAALSARTSDYQPGAIVRVPAGYDDRLAGVMSEFKGLGGCRQTSLASDILAEVSDLMPGLYEVIEVRELKYKDGTAAVLVLRSEDGEGADSDELHCLAGLVELRGGALVPSAGGGALATAKRGAKGLAAAAVDAGKRGASTLGRVAAAEGRRKMGKAAKELGGDTVLGAHNAVKEGIAGLLGAFGLEKFAPAAKLGIDLAATSGARMLGEALQESSPGVARVLLTTSEIIEDKQAQATAQAARAAIAPLTGALRSSFGEAVGRALAPALNTIGALPAPSEDPEEGDEDEVEEVEAPKPARGRKAAAAKPAAKAAPRARKPKAAATTPAPAELEDADDEGSDDDAAA